MKKLINILILTIGLLVISGCSTDDVQSEIEEPQENISVSTSKKGLIMVQGLSYPIQEGDTIKKNAPDTVVVIDTDLVTGQTTAILQSGSAILY